jgi:hypothetical protein
VAPPLGVHAASEGVMAQPFRTSRGGRIDRARPIRFSFNGRTVETSGEVISDDRVGCAPAG